MKYISTRGGIKPITFLQSVMTGLADDGGLIIPENIPDISDKIDSLKKLNYSELAFEIIKLFTDDIPQYDLKNIINKSYSDNFKPDVAPVVKAGNLFIAELFHGPTLSFKDVALQFLGNLFEYTLTKNGGHLNILGATSGDTGSAGIYGVKGKKNINIFVMHPYKKISDIQEKQMTSVLDSNVFNIAVKGSFDDCQKIMKDIASDIDFKKKYNIGAINSVNWARVLAQIVYYFYVFFKVEKITKDKKIKICVPTGNFGNILAAWFASKMGLPIDRLILATNENDILSRFFKSGEYSKGKVAFTLSPAMDIQVASNFERYLYYKLDSDAVKLKNVLKEFNNNGSITIKNSDDKIDPFFMSEKAGAEEVLKTIKKYYEKYNYILDPHTAVGIYAADYFYKDNDTIICMATAHPAKFPDAIKTATGKDIAHHPDIDKLKNLPTKCGILDDDKNIIKDFIIKSL